MALLSRTSLRAKLVVLCSALVLSCCAVLLLAVPWALGAQRHEARAWLLLSCGLILAFGAAAALAMGWLLARPIRRITDVAQRIAAGEGVHVSSLPVDREDEIGRLARVFAMMLSRLYAQQAEIHRMNEDLARRVQERTQELARTEEALAELNRTQERLVIADRRLSVGRLAAGVAHEINNPMSFISGNLDFVATGLADLRERATAPCDVATLEELSSAIDDCRQGAQRVVKIVRGLKTFARDDEDERACIPLESPVEAAISMALHELKHRGQIVREYRQNPTVLANEVRLCQVFLNLLINAAQALPEGPRDRNEIRVVIDADAAGRAVVEVRDTGAGIPPEHMGRIFDAFFTTKPVGVGSGLGLSISRNIIEGFGGAIACESLVGRGTTFRVILPRSGEEDPARCTPEVPPRGPPGASGEEPTGAGRPRPLSRLAERAGPAMLGR